MLSPNGDDYLSEILSYVKFTFDREDIRSELESHLTDKIDWYLEQGYDVENAEQLSIHDMGNAKEIGTELDKQHNPIIGWIWRITNVMVVLIIFCFCAVFVLFSGLSIRSSMLDEITKSEIVYKIDLKEQVKIDDRVIRITNVIYDKDGDMNIFYESYMTPFWRTGWWNLGSLGDISDNLGNTYITGGGMQKGGFVTRGVWTVDQFSEDADLLIISYDRYKRKYRFEIPLKAGEKNE